MKPIAYNPNNAMQIELINDDTKEHYIGEYIDMRINRDTIPEGKYAYNCRHDDGDWVTPVTIEKGRILVNFAGTLIVDKPIEFPEGKDYICVTEEN